MNTPIDFKADEKQLSGIKAIFCDVDGTLLNANSELSNEMANAVRNIKEKMPFYLVSGRNVSCLRAIYDTLKLDTPIISVNGGLISGPDDAIIEAKPLDQSSVSRLLSEVSARFPSVSINLYSQLGWYTGTVSNYYAENEARIVKKQPTILKDIVCFGQEPIFKVIFLDNKETSDAIFDLIKDEYPAFSIIHNGPNYIEIFSAEAGKGQAIDSILKKTGLAKESAICFGDSLIDLSMFDSCGISVAMANGHPAVKQKATIITRSNADMGVKSILDILETL